LLAFVGDALLSGEVRMGLRGGKLVVQFAKAPPVREERRAVEDGVGSRRVRAVGGLAAGEAERGYIGARTCEQGGEVVQPFDVA
jgi:hypothetical protein